MTISTRHACELAQTLRDACLVNYQNGEYSGLPYDAADMIAALVWERDELRTANKVLTQVVNRKFPPGVTAARAKRMAESRARLQAGAALVNAAAHDAVVALEATESKNA